MSKGKFSGGAGAVLLAAAVALAGFWRAERADAAALTWNPAGVNTNWSNSLNWNANGLPGGNAITLASVGSFATGGTSTVDQNFAISSLTLANSAQQTINLPGTTLTVGSGGFAYTDTGTSNYTTIMNGGGNFTVSYSSANFQVGQFSSSASSSEGCNLNMSGLSTFTFSGSNFQVGGYGSNPSEFRDNGGTLTLAPTSSITANIVYVGYTNGANGGPTSYLYLSTGTNTIAANAINIAVSKASGQMLFQAAANPAPAVNISGTASSTSRVPLTIGDHNASTGTGSTGIVDFSLGQVNAWISTLIDGGCDNTGSGGKGTGTFIVGTNPNSLVDVNTVEVGEAASGGGAQATGTLTIQGGTFRFGTFPAEPGTQNINFQGGTIASNSPAGSTMVPNFNLGISGNTAAVTFGQPSGVGTGALTFSGNVTLVGNTTVTANVPTTISGGISGNSALTTAGLSQLFLTGNNNYGGGTTITGGTVSLGAAGSLGSGNVTVQPGSTLDASAYVGTLSIGGSLGLNSGTLACSPANNQITVAGGLSLGGVSYVVPNAVLAAGTYPLFSNFTSISGGSANLAAGGFFASSQRQSFTFDASSGTAVNLVVSGTVGNLQWNGGTNGTWDAGSSQSWFNTTSGSADVFYTVDAVTFTDTPGTATTVNISGAVLPGSVTMNNMNIAYTFSGNGSIGGPTSLVINGPGA